MMRRPTPRPRARAAYLPMLALMLVASGYARAATHDIEGFVVDDDNRPLEGATVSVEGLQIATQTDSLGGFVLSAVPEGRHRLTARMGCVMSGHIDDMQVPRPLRVPLPIRLARVDCAGDAGDASTQRALVAHAVRAFARVEQQAIALALLAVDDVAIGDATVPVAHLDAGAEFAEAIWLSVCVRVIDDRHALVRIVRSSPPVPEELDMFAGDAALLSLTRPSVDAEWGIARQLVCVDSPPDESGPGDVRAISE